MKITQKMPWLYISKLLKSGLQKHILSTAAHSENNQKSVTLSGSMSHNTAHYINRWSWAEPNINLGIGKHSQNLYLLSYKKYWNWWVFNTTVHNACCKKIFLWRSLDDQRRRLSVYSKSIVWMRAFTLCQPF